jgi:large subunit ribosomal protein L21
MYAIIKSGGKQYRVAIGETVDVELLAAVDPGAKIEFSDVLFAFDGSNTQFGKPTIPNFQVFGEVLGTIKGEKVTTLKYKRSHNYCRKWGHRQKYTRVKITGIGQPPKEGNHGT